MIRILYIGDSWLGSCARSLKEALVRNKRVLLDEVNTDLVLPNHRTRFLRLLNRFARRVHVHELHHLIVNRASVFNPDFILIYKGSLISGVFVNNLRSRGYKVINIYPDLSPHAHGKIHKKAINTYDLVISTKPFHPNYWSEIYGYTNTCVFVPQGYDSQLHLKEGSVSEYTFDLVMVATWRYEYGSLMHDVARLIRGQKISVAIGGNGWEKWRGDYPLDWVFLGEQSGRSYVETLRTGKICIAPVTREVVINGVRQDQPGDEDSTRTYELAAAKCFFIHRRTEFVKYLYDEDREVPMFETPEELVNLINYYLPQEQERKRMAEAAHRKAVPAYSLDKRAEEILTVLEQHFTK